MASTITTIAVVDITNPTEVQTWLDNNPTAVIVAMWNNENTFFVVYQ